MNETIVYTLYYSIDENNVIPEKRIGKSSFIL